MYLYQKTGIFFAQTAEDIRDLAAAELSELGAGEIRPGYGGIHFHADSKTLYRINYNARLVSRILAPLASFYCPTPDHLYRHALRIKWTDFFAVNKTFAVFSNVSNSRISHSHFAALRLKDAVADSFMRQAGTRPDVDTKNPDVTLNLFIHADRATISLDTSGKALHYRGYRKHAVSSPMRETVAAAMIRISEWDGSLPLYDPMCGSGTILAEALMAYCRIPSGWIRPHFGFERLPDYDARIWKNVRTECRQQIRDLPEGLIGGSDISGKAVAISSANLGLLPGGGQVSLHTTDFSDIAALRNHVIITNPPYGIRMNKNENLDPFFKNLGDFLKQRCAGSTAYVYFGNREWIKKIGLRPSLKKPLQTGGLDGRLVKYEMY